MAEGTRGLSIFRRQNKEGEDVVIEDDHVSADLSNYHLLNSIGVGAYAKVYRAQVKSTGAEVSTALYCNDSLVSSVIMVTRLFHQDTPRVCTPRTDNTIFPSSETCSKEMSALSQPHGY